MRRAVIRAWVLMAMATAMAMVLIAPTAHAACTGSGTTWSCTAGSTIAQINAALASASDGATLTMAPGSYAWGSTLVFSVSKGASLLCATPGSCQVSMSGSLWQWANWGTSHKRYRISGFDFTGVGAYFIWLYATGNATATLTSIRFDHNRLTVATSGADIITFGEISGTNLTIHGVIDHNTFTTTTGNSRWVVNYCQTAANWPIGRIGTASNLFIEDNTFSDQSQVNAGNAALDTDGGPLSWVIRYNRFVNARIEHHGYYWSFPGPANSEVYGNTFSTTSGVLNGDRSIKHQGSGEWIVFDNVITPSSGHGAGILFQNYRSFYDTTNPCDGSRTEDGNRAPAGTYFGYPCRRQPGRNADGVLKPMYFWNNRWGDTQSTVAPEVSCPDQGIPNRCANHLVANRDYYQGGVAQQTSATTPFNGTSGVGFGTLAFRPTTCVPTPEPLDVGHGGVAYWATDARVLYRCSATNTWVAHYTPYTYPHPLTATGGPATPTGLSVMP